VEKIDFNILEEPKIQQVVFKEALVGDAGEPIKHFIIDREKPHIIYIAPECIDEDKDELLSKGFSEKGINISYVEPWKRLIDTRDIGNVVNFCSDIFRDIMTYRAKYLMKGPIIVAGRSLGAVVALALAVKWQYEILALIFESGFKDAFQYLSYFGIELSSQYDRDPFSIIPNIKQFSKPVLFLHCAKDPICPPSELEWVISESRSKSNQFYIIPGEERYKIAALSEGYYFSIINDFFNKLLGIRTKKLTSRQMRLREKAKRNILDG